MAKKKSLVRYDKILISSLGLVFGLIALAVLFKAVLSNTEQRSQAAWIDKAGKIHCSGANGSKCYVNNCPVCPPGKACPYVACRIGAGTCQNKVCVLKAAPTPSKASCSGPNGSKCSLNACPTCTADGKCPAIACREAFGTCQNSVCVATTRVTPVPSPGCRYVAVQCARAPCPPTIVCNMPNGGVGACTKDLKICPDRTTVGRTGPNCEFAACPASTIQRCTQELKICPDGKTKVGRSGPNCTFAACPTQVGCPSVCNGSSCYKPCASPGGSTACTKDAFTCPDGMKVGRSGPTCEFYCPNTKLGV